VADRFADGTLTFDSPAGGQQAVRLAIPLEAGDDLAAALRDGSYRPTPSARLVWQLAAGRRLFDLGAHLGSVALPSARLGSEVLAVEPSPRNFAALSESAARNGLQLQLVNAAVSDAPGTAELVEDGPFSRVIAHRGGGAVAVQVRTLAELVALAGSAPDVLKIDVEGHELEALAGMEALLEVAGSAPDVVVESNGHVLRLRERSPRTLVARLRALGYRVYVIEAGALRPLPADGLQTETVVDLLATMAATLPWPEAPVLAEREVARRLADELGHANRWHRAWAAAELAEATAALLARRRIRRGLDRAASDDSAEVREAAAWWRARQPLRRGRLGLRRR
jgi:FkbM family methyltransferase